MATHSSGRNLAVSLHKRLLCNNYRNKLRKKLEIPGGLTAQQYELLVNESAVKEKPTSSKPPKMRAKKYNKEPKDDNAAPTEKKERRKRKSNAAAAAEASDSDGNAVTSSSGNLMKRRRKMELKLEVGAGGKATQHLMGPPDDTPRKLLKLGKSSARGASLAGPLESPLSLDKHVNFDDNFPVAADTPTLHKLMTLLPGSTKPLSTLTSDSLKFDFDEVVQQFPSPHPGGTSGFAGANETSTWSSQNMDSCGSVGSIGSGFFTFQEGSYRSSGASDVAEALGQQQLPTPTQSKGGRITVSPFRSPSPVIGDVDQGKFGSMKSRGKLASSSSAAPTTPATTRSADSVTAQIAEVRLTDCFLPHLIFR